MSHSAFPYTLLLFTFTATPRSTSSFLLSVCLSVCLSVDHCFLLSVCLSITVFFCVCLSFAPYLLRSVIAVPLVQRCRYDLFGFVKLTQFKKQLGQVVTKEVLVARFESRLVIIYRLAVVVSLY